jgi:adhesin/invasin
VPVSFTATAGTLSATSVTTDGNGEARVQLTTTRAADVTATAGAASGKVSVTLNAPLGITITPPGSLQAATPASFTIGVTASSGTVVRSVSVNWGDGASTSLSALTGSTSVSHTFLTAGSYVVTVTAEDTNGEKTSSSTSVTVVPVQVSITVAGPSTVVINTPVTYTISVTPTTLQVKSYTLTIDGAPAGGGNETSTTVSYTVKFTSLGQKTLKVIVATVPGDTYTKDVSVTVNATP